MMNRNNKFDHKHTRNVKLLNYWLKVDNFCCWKSMFTPPQSIKQMLAEHSLWWNQHATETHHIYPLVNTPDNKSRFHYFRSRILRQNPIKTKTLKNTFSLHFWSESGAMLRVVPDSHSPHVAELKNLQGHFWAMQCLQWQLEVHWECGTTPLVHCTIAEIGTYKFV